MTNEEKKPVESTESEPGRLGRPLTRRNVIKAGGIAALGLAFSKPIIETIAPRPVFAAYAPPNGGNEGCTPGYWKNHENWPIAPTTTLGSVFTGLPGHIDTGVAGLASDSFLTALSYMGGATWEEKAEIMLRAAAAAYLNAVAFPKADPPPNFSLTPADVVGQVNAVLAITDETTSKTEMVVLGEALDGANNAGECDFFLDGGP